MTIKLWIQYCECKQSESIGNLHNTLTEFSERTQVLRLIKVIKFVVNILSDEVPVHNGLRPSVLEGTETER